MVQDLRRETIWCDSTNKSSRLHGYIWWPEEGVVPQAAVQLVHGMAEHIARYDEFARYLNERGFVVYGHDHIGHGQSVTSSDQLGDLPVENGTDILVEDVHRVRTEAIARISGAYRTSPQLFIFGHSMGSFVVRAYLARHAFGLSGAIICGTGFMPPRTSATANMLAKTIAKVRGGSYRSKLLHNLGVGSYNQDIENPETELDWLSFNKDNVARYIADENCGFMFSAGGYATVTDLMREVCTKECVAAYPKDLPLLFIAGTEDPVGERGEGVSRAADLAHNVGVTDVRCRLYAGMRHEILNERGRQVVYDDVASWMEGHIK
ncbi:MAG: alpha/beta fold hydrolase [Atopobiaceae bacterium]|nr:alpha/beta fold hydrolase [Atopobiaceae bacterium]